MASSLLALGNEATVVTEQTPQSYCITYTCAHSKPHMVMSHVYSRSYSTCFSKIFSWYELYMLMFVSLFLCLWPMKMTHLVMQMHSLNT